MAKHQVKFSCKVQLLAVMFTVFIAVSNSYLMKDSNGDSFEPWESAEHDW